MNFIELEAWIRSRLTHYQGPLNDITNIIRACTPEYEALDIRYWIRETGLTNDQVWQVFNGFYYLEGHTEYSRFGQALHTSFRTGTNLTMPTNCSCRACRDLRMELNYTCMTAQDYVREYGMPEIQPGEPFHYPKKRLAGLEVEYVSCENWAPLARFLSTWRAGHHYDGSCGYEVVTAPLAGPRVADCLTELGKAMTEAKAYDNKNCGVHVHVDAGDFRWPDMYRLLNVYARLEPMLYVLAGQIRASNDFCRPCGTEYKIALREDDKKNGVLGVAYTDNRDDDDTIENGRQYVHQNKPGKKDGGRYKGLNICPWLAGRRRKPQAPDTTVEFRLHQNSLEPRRLIEWTKVCVAIVDWCAQHSDKEAESLPASPLRALLQISPDSETYIKERIKAFRQETKRNGRQRRRIHVRANHEWRIEA